MSKLITFVVPCYNSAPYLHRAIESLLGFDDTEIILVNDGSDKDNTPELCEHYASQYPETIRVIHQENGGHGAAVMRGIQEATGVYCKVVDSDDWLERDSLTRVLSELKNLPTAVDMCIAHYVYEHTQYPSKPIGYKGVLPERRVFGWQEVKRFKPSQYLLMHSVIYRTQLLHDCGLALPKHTFYVDNIFVYQPLPFTKTLYYVPANLYRYYIGRDDQSVNQEVMKTRVDQQVRVTKRMIVAHNVQKLATTEPRLAKYMVNKVAMMMSISSIFLLMHKDVVHLQQRAELWQFLQNQSPWLYKKIRWRSIGFFTMLPGALGRVITLGLYRIIRRIFKFN